jgi:hypothetical protein
VCDSAGTMPKRRMARGARYHRARRGVKRKTGGNR